MREQLKYLFMIHVLLLTGCSLLKKPVVNIDQELCFLKDRVASASQKLSEVKKPLVYQKVYTIETGQELSDAAVWLEWNKKKKRFELIIDKHSTNNDVCKREYFEFTTPLKKEHKDLSLKVYRGIGVIKIFGGSVIYEDGKNNL